MLNILETLKWVATACFITATISLLSPTIAAESLFPWIVYLLGNLVWGYDSYRTNNKQWVWVAVFFCIWDALIIVARMTGFEILTHLTPYIQVLENLI